LLVALAGIAWISLRLVRLWHTGKIEMNDHIFGWRDHPFFFIIAIGGHLGILYGCIHYVIFFFGRRY
jgi:hypothetical protein